MIHDVFDHLRLAAAFTGHAVRYALRGRWRPACSALLFARLNLRDAVGPARGGR